MPERKIYLYNECNDCVGAIDFDEKQWTYITEVRKELDDAVRSLAAKEAEIASSLSCPICGGDGRASTDGRPCACNGTGKWYDCYLSMQAEIAEANKRLADQQYRDLQLLGERDEKTRHLENELAEAKEDADDLAKLCERFQDGEAALRKRCEEADRLYHLGNPSQVHDIIHEALKEADRDVLQSTE